MSLRNVKTWWELPGEDLPVRGFFPAVARFFPSATTLFVEGCAINSEVLSKYDTHREPGRYLPGRDTVFPRSTTRRCRFEESLVNDIEQLAASHGVPALFDHVTVYSGAEPLIYWHDAFANVLRINGEVSESTVVQFSQTLGVPCRSA